MATSTYPTPLRPTSAARAPGPAHLSRTHAAILGRSTESGSGANGTVEKGSRVRIGRSVCRQKQMLYAKHTHAVHHAS
jgi:hypothetical protein